MPERGEHPSTMLRHSQELRVPNASLYTPSAEAVASIAGALETLLAGDETITFGMQAGRLSRAPQRERESAWVGDMAWYLITDTKLVLEIAVKASPATEGGWVTVVTRSRRWPLADLRLVEIEETRPPAPNDLSAKVRLGFGGGDVLAIDSAGIRPLTRGAQDDLRGPEQVTIVREFVARVIGRS